MILAAVPSGAAQEARCPAGTLGDIHAVTIGQPLQQLSAAAASGGQRRTVTVRDDGTMMISTAATDPGRPAGRL